MNKISKMLVYKVKIDGYSIMLEDGMCDINIGDILFLEEFGVISDGDDIRMQSGKLVGFFRPCYILKKLYYNFGDDIICRDNLNIVDPVFRRDVGVSYRLKNSRFVSELFEDVSIEWNRENKLIELGI